MCDTPRDGEPADDDWDDSDDPADEFEDCTDALESVVLRAIAPGIPSGVKAIRLELRLDPSRESGMEVRVGTWSGLAVPAFAVPRQAVKPLAGFVAQYADQFAPPDSGPDTRPLMSWYATCGQKGKWRLGGGQTGGDPFVTDAPVDEPRSLPARAAPVLIQPSPADRGLTARSRIGKRLAAMWAGTGKGLRLVRGGRLAVTDGTLAFLDPDTWPDSIACTIRVPSGDWEIAQTEWKDSFDASEAVLLRRSDEVPHAWFDLDSYDDSEDPDDHDEPDSSDDLDEHGDMGAPRSLAWVDGAGLAALGEIWCRGEASAAALRDEVAAVRESRVGVIRPSDVRPVTIGISTTPRGEAQVWLGVDRRGEPIAIVVTEAPVEDD